MAFSAKTRAICTHAVQCFADQDGEFGLLSLHRNRSWCSCSPQPFFTSPSRGSISAITAPSALLWAQTAAGLCFLPFSPSSTKSINSYREKCTHSSASLKLCPCTEESKQQSPLFCWENAPVFTLTWSFLESLLWWTEMSIEKFFIISCTQI